jgi:hypothetical protein
MWLERTASVPQRSVLSFHLIEEKPRFGEAAFALCPAPEGLPVVHGHRIPHGSAGLADLRRSLQVLSLKFFQRSEQAAVMTRTATSAARRAFIFTLAARTLLQGAE